MYIFFCNACHLIIPARVTRPIGLKESNYDYDPGHRNNFYVLKSHLYTCIFHFLDLKYKKNTYIACRIRHKKTSHRPNRYRHFTSSEVNKGLKMHIIITMDGIMHQQDVGNSKGNVSFLLRLYFI